MNHFVQIKPSDLLKLTIKSDSRSQFCMNLVLVLIVDEHININRAFYFNPSYFPREGTVGQF